VSHEVSHRTTYRYRQPVSVSHHLLHLAPRDAAFQSCRGAAIEISPAPTVRSADVDYFGNPTTFVTIQQSHTELVLHALSVILSVIEVRERAIPEPASTPAWESVRNRTVQDLSAEALRALEFTFASPYVPLSSELRSYAAASFPAGRPVLEAARELARRIHADFRYDSGATTPATGVAEAFSLRRGVCQDFAHVGLACLRSLGLPARYVSGYLLTRPPEGKERLVGADASHAWLAVWMPGHDWVDFDPTNDLIPGREHVTVAWGRGYDDVSPVSGVLFGGGEHEVSVAVDVVVAG
jgi:transglutaminase-like putative cysteine protease